MSGWGFGAMWGGAGSVQKKREQTKSAILHLRSTLDMLAKREKHLQTQMEEQDAIARKNVTTNKTVAKTALRRKKDLEHQLEQTTAQMMTLQREVSSIETANINKETLTAMQNAGQAMKSIHGSMTVDKVDEIMEGLREQHAVSEEIAAALTSGNQTIDETDLEEEFEILQQEELDNKMLKTGPGPVSDAIHSLPNQPIGPLKHTAVEEDEEEELRKLQAEMAM